MDRTAQQLQFAPFVGLKITAYQKNQDAILMAYDWVGNSFLAVWRPGPFEDGLLRQEEKFPATWPNGLQKIDSTANS
jgi:hypothetical protein